MNTLSTRVFKKKKIKTIENFLIVVKIIKFLLFQILMSMALLNL